MNLDLLYQHCMGKRAVEETFPFDEDTLVFKVQGKMFALISLSDPNSVNLKCDPVKSIEYREQYEAVNPGYHMNKQHWNTVDFNKDVHDRLLLEMVDESYRLVVKTLPKSIRQSIEH